ncbi:MAG: hypothetical protein GPJ54_02760 [Candidatus Heimdallarchaeota archaeon]|nr:hypothetical protein [Candidatus Heimdallarchaeota archaeon]
MSKSTSIIVFGILVFAIASTTIPLTNAQPTPGSQCENSTFEVTIKAIPTIKYDKSKIEVPPATCVKITLTNEDSVLHDFAIDGLPGDDGIEQVYILVEAGETASFNIMTPDADKTFEFYCWQPGHKAAGMVGDFIVGEGSKEEDAPGFEFTLTIFAFLTLIIFYPKLRSRNKS